MPATTASDRVQPSSETRQRLDELLELAGDLLPHSSLDHLHAARERVTERRFNLVVLGEFKRGKSSLINALLGEEALPTGVVPLTSAITVVRHGPRPRLLVYHEDGRADERPPEELARYITETQNPGNYRGVQLAVLELDSDLLEDGLQLVDTPGIGSIHAHNTEVTHSFLARVDAALCVLAADQPLSVAERELFAEAAEQAPRLVFVLNKQDLIDDEERVAARAFVERGLAEFDGYVRGDSQSDQTPPLLGVSARSGEGIDELRDCLRRLLDAEGAQLLEASVRTLAARETHEAISLVELESRAIRMPLEDLQRRGTMFERRAAELGRAHDEARDLLERGVRRLLDERVNEPLTGYAKDHEDRLVRAIDELAATSEERNPRRLAAKLRGASDQHVREEFTDLAGRLEGTLAEELGALQRRYAQRVAEIIDDVVGAAAELFGPGASWQGPQIDLHEASRFTFKLQDPESGLEQIVSAGRTVAPGSLGRAVVIREARSRLIAMTDRHAGRLRSELVEHARRAVRAYERELSAFVEDAIDSIRAALERALEEHVRGSAAVSERLESLAGREAGLRGLLAELEPSPPAGQNGAAGSA
jgi:GTP-binding protein EngB required for normal cell division